MLYDALVAMEFHKPGDELVLERWEAVQGVAADLNRQIVLEIEHGRLDSGALPIAQLVNK